MRANVRPWMATFLGLSLTLGSLPALAMQAPTRVGAAKLDAGAAVLTIPYAGQRPAVRIQKLAPMHYIVDLGGAQLAREEVQSGLVGGSRLLAGWSLDETPTGQTVRLRLTLNQDVDPQLHWEQAGHAVRLTLGAAPRYQLAAAPKPQMVAPKPQAQAPKPQALALPSKAALPKTSAPMAPAPKTTFAGRPAAPKIAFHRQPAMTPVKTHQPLTALQLANRTLPSQTAFQLPQAPHALALPVRTALGKPPVPHRGPAVVGAPRFDAARNLLVVPVNGNVDVRKLSVVRLGKRWAYLDVPASRPTFTGVKYQDGASKLMSRWVMAKRPHQQATRLSFNLGADAGLDVKLVGNELLVAVKPTSAAIAHRPAAPAPVALKPGAHKPAAVAHMPAALAAVAAGTTLARPYYDQARHALVLPYTGETPLYRVNEQLDAAATLEIKGVLAPAGRLEQRFATTHALEAWAVARNPGAGTVNLAMTFRHPSEVVVAVDPARHQLLLLPQPKLAGDEQVAEQPAGTLSAARLPAEGRQLFIPLTGAVPAYSIEQVSPTQAYVDFEGARLEAGGVQYVEPPFHATVNRWLLQERTLNHTVRLALTLNQPGGVAVFQDRTNQRLVVELNGEEPRVGARTRSQRPTEWPGEQRMVGKKAS